MKFTYQITPLSENRLYKYMVTEIKEFESDHVISKNVIPVGMFMNLHDCYDYIAERKQRNLEIAGEEITYMN